VTDQEFILSSKGDDKTKIRLQSSVALKEEDGAITADFTLAPNETADFLLAYIDGHDRRNERELKEQVTKCLFATVNYWKDWITQSTYQGRWMEMVNRSALVLKLLSSHQYGSIIAAPTFSLPETIGAKRNWDYRYTWIRDASFTVYTLLRLGYGREAGNFINWVEKRCQDIKDNTPLGIMYSINGERQITESILDNFEGYKQSAPVRIGNDAYRQLQLDIYGELMDAVYLYNKYEERISHDFWKDMAKQIDWLNDHWRDADEGIWEVRGGKQHFLYSRLQCWVAFDRAIKLAKMRSFPHNPSWREQRDIIFKSIYNDYWDDNKKAFMQYPGSATVDASALLMPLIRFISPKDPKWLATLQCIEKELVSDSLVYRYRPEVAAPDGFISREGTFTMCTFWYVECLSRSGQLEKARLYFEKMLGYANHLGLFSEQLGFRGEHLGNFPQAFSHLGLISAAYNLDKQLNNSRNKNVNHSI